MDFTGSLFQQKTKAICVMNNQLCFGDTTFHYIHQNPYKAGLVKRMEEWEFSSFKDYIGLRDEQLCNRQMAFEYLDLDVNTIYQDSYNVINDPELIKLIESGGVLHPGGVGHPQIPTGLYQTIHKRN